MKVKFNKNSINFFNFFSIEIPHSKAFPATPQKMNTKRRVIYIHFIHISNKYMCERRA